jgi:hypothetical protein
MSTFFRALERAEQDRRWRHPTEQPESPTNRRPLFAAASPTGLVQLQLLFDYSKFQICLYTTIAIIFAAAIAFEPTGFKIHRGLLSLAVVFIGMAGTAAGIVASRCVYFTSWRELWTAKIGPFRWNCLRGEHWTYVQHVCFGIALAAALLSVLLGDGKWLQSVPCWGHWPAICPPH